jgi:hypothetical protein
MIRFEASRIFKCGERTVLKRSNMEFKRDHQKNIEDEISD